MEKGSSSRADGSGDAFSTLQFGRKIYFNDASGGECSSKAVAAPALPKMSQLVAGKKAKGVAQGCGQPLPPPRCQVEGCSSDLKGAKSYYCRHKVCGMHSKSPKVIVAGLEQRFCQQCSRFHLLKEFDQGKRSCRRRLAGHNERRRKPPPVLLSSRYDDSSRHRGFLMDFMHSRPPDATKNILWPTMRNNDRVATNQLQGRSIQSLGGVISNALPALFSATELALGECIAGVSDSTCALSLLSTQPWDAAAASAAPRNQRDPVITPSSDFEMSHANMASSYLNSSWAFKDHAAGSSGRSHEMGLRQIHGAENCQFSGELEPAPQGNRHCPDAVSPGELYDHLHDLHWPL